ncbi:DUF3046 domain-containing protein [Microbacterium sp. RURRCA19A]|uniref:DUF3046 domain-containing protein n=1 Tax=Microbacterium sp. RURRCA19A TaxID=1907391 RepID=UPI000955E9B5|nr:DUF3046 domain-containing protein [Microbacterium sp. RURRCA19A]SIR66517.1 Protein of unknown function [Microbacterium sp. RURRCA19A]
MRRSEFDRAVADEFGARGSSLLTDLVLTSVGGRTSADALAAGVDPRDVWIALCEETDVPRERRYGVGRLDPRRR